MGRLVNVSNRISLPRRTSAPGGLAVGVLAAMRARGGLWFGWDGKTCSGEPGRPAITVRDRITYATIPVPEELYEPYYNGFANSTLWPLFHYFLGLFRYSDQEFTSYLRVNELFARALLPLLERDDLLWVHDYHLIPLAERLRALGAAQPIGFFLHIPFPNIEVLRALPTFTEIMRALLTYDVVGFQTETDQRSFLGAAAAIWGPEAVLADGSVRFEGRSVVTGVFPIGVDLEAIGREAREAARTEPVERMVRGLLERRLIIGVDRLDYSKGLVQRFEAYQHFLEAHPEERGQVTYLQIAPLSRTDVLAYAQIRDTLEQTAGRTNGRFADTDWTPIRYLNRNFPHETLMGFLRAAQVCLVTPVRDGMNLVAKEFIAAQDPEDPGVLVLSSLAGAAQELTDALLVNPYDPRGIAQAIRAALSMPLAERRRRHERLLDHLRAHDIHAWHGRFLQALEGARRAGSTLRRPAVEVRLS